MPTQQNGQTNVGKLPTNFLSVIDHFVGLALKSEEWFLKRRLFSPTQIQRILSAIGSLCFLICIPWVNFETWSFPLTNKQVCSETISPANNLIRDIVHCIKFATSWKAWNVLHTYIAWDFFSFHYEHFQTPKN